MAVASTLADGNRVTGWRSDLDMLVPEMARLHPKIDHAVSRSDLDAAVAALAARVPTATNDELMVGVLGVVAKVSGSAGCDAHTGAFIWGTGHYPVESLPLRLWWFDEGLVIVDALPPYQELIGRRLATVAGHPVSDIVAAIEPLVPRDNGQTVRLLLPRYILIPQLLRGLGLADQGPVELGLVAPGVAPVATPRNITVQPITMVAYNAWAGPYGLHLPANPEVRYLSRIGDALWWEQLDDGTLFVQYNRVDRLPATLIDQLGSAVHAPDVARVVLDIRHNYGGEVSALTAILRTFGDADAGTSGHLYLITGRNTFSAASLLAARLVDSTSAIVVGEPMGGCPTAYGDSDDFELPYSRIAVSVASMLEVGVTADDPRTTLEPDLPARLTPAAWEAGTDPALEAILTKP